MFKSGLPCSVLTSILFVVNIWDVLGEEQIVKGEYKVISGRVYVMFSFVVVHLLVGLFRFFDLYTFFLLAMTLHGMAKVNESSQLEMEKKSQLLVIYGAIRQSRNLFVLVETRFGHAFLVDTGSSTGEILGHSKVRYSTFPDIYIMISRLFTYYF